MNMYNDVTTMIELTQEELDSVTGAEFGYGGYGLGGYGLGGYGLGACGFCGGYGGYGGYGLGACGTCGFATGPFVSAVTNSAVSSFAQNYSLVTSNAITNSAFTYYGN